MRARCRNCLTKADARFLSRTEAGRAIQLDGLIWLDRAATTGLWAERDVQDKLARLLDAT